MSKIALVSPASGTATFSITTPSGTSTDRTLNLPDAGGTVVSDTAAQTLTNKTFSGAQGFGTASLAEPTGTAPLYMCRAWVNFNGTGTVAIRASGNVSSITDNGTGLYTVNFTTAMPDLNYATIGQAWYSGVTGALFNISLSPDSTTSKLVGTTNPGATASVDVDHITVSIFR